MNCSGVSLFRIVCCVFCIVAVSAVRAGDVFVDVQDPGCVSGSGQPDPYAVIYCAVEDAVADAQSGDVIHINPGLYAPVGPVIFDKTLTILGPQANVDPRPSFGSTRTPGSPAEAVISGQGTIDDLLVIQADSVEINGLEVTNATDDMIYQAGAYIYTAIRYCILHQTGDEAVQLLSCDDCMVEYNNIFNTGVIGEMNGDGVCYATNATNSTLQFNEIHDINSEHGCFYAYNTFYINVLDNLMYNNVWGGGIRWGRNSSSSNVGGLIQGNVIHSVGEGGIDVEAYPAAGTETLEIVGNEIYGITNPAWGAIHIKELSAYIAVEENDLHGNTVAIWIDDESGAPASTTITVIHNNIDTNVQGILNEGTGILTAEDNWWGDAGGPEDLIGSVEVPPCGSDPLVEINSDGIGDPAGEFIDYCPWLTSPFSPATPTPSPSPTFTATITPTATPTGPTPTPPPIPATNPAGSGLILAAIGVIMIFSGLRKR
ncbi:MAG TPA: right-handed parallel beta-helix repeat-containing protein [bacterium]|nr:right-handed parallel beta-helix repeat-containing protein [bacterium]